MPRAVHQFTVGVSGAGKTYFRAAKFLTETFLPEHTGNHWSNFPFGPVPEHGKPTREGETYRDRIAKEAAKGDEAKEAAYFARIKTIPPEVIDLWARGKSGPWEFFGTKDMTGAHIAIDEIHNFVPKSGGPKVRYPKEDAMIPVAQAWKQWLGELRHDGMTIEFLTQSEEKVSKVIDTEAAVRIDIESREEERDPLFGIPFGDWYELRAGLLTRSYDRVSLVITSRKSKSKWKEVDRETFRLDPRFFRLYDSFSAPVKKEHGAASGLSERRQWERRSRIGLAWWFFCKYPGRLISRLGVAAALLFLCTGGGASVMGGFIDLFQMSARSNAPVLAPGATTTPPASTAASAATQAAGPHAQTLAFERERQATAVALDQARAAAAAAEAEAAAVKAANEAAVALAMIGPDWVALRDGTVFFLGEPIPFGPLQGTSLHATDQKNRTATLADGRVVRLGGGDLGRLLIHQADRTDSAADILGGAGNRPGGGAAATGPGGGPVDGHAVR